MLILSKIIATIISFKKSEDGATAIEYGLIAALIAVAIIVAVTATGTSLSGLFDGITDELDAAID